jgi:hypothetical protein
MSSDKDGAMATIRKDGDINFNKAGRKSLGLSDSRLQYMRLWVDRDTNELGFSFSRERREEDGALSVKIQRNKTDVRFSAKSALKLLNHEFGTIVVTEVYRYTNKKTDSLPKWAIRVPMPEDD